MHTKLTFNDFYRMHQKASELGYHWDRTTMCWHIDQDALDLDSFAQSAFIRPVEDTASKQAEILGIRAIFYPREVRGEMQGYQVILRLDVMGHELFYCNGTIEEKFRPLLD